MNCGKLCTSRLFRVAGFEFRVTVPRKAQKQPATGGRFWASTRGGIRTPDPDVRSAVLCPLSYAGIIYYFLFIPSASSGQSISGFWFGESPTRFELVTGKLEVCCSSF